MSWMNRRVSKGFRGVMLAVIVGAICTASGVQAEKPGKGKAAKKKDASGQESIGQMTQAAATFVNSLDKAQRKAALYDFDDKNRFIHRIAPFSPGGLAFGTMTRGQFSLVHAMLGSALSGRGHNKVSGIIELEDILTAGEKERDKENRFHGSDKYRVAIFGEPKAGGTWSWRIHGHHLCLAFTVVDGKLYAAGPAFLGAEPHRIGEGPRAGWSVLEAEENLGRALVSALTDDERSRAKLADAMPGDMFSASKRKVDFLGEPTGIAIGDLSDEKAGLLKDIIIEYVGNLPKDLQHTRWKTVKSGGWENVHFGWIGSNEADERIYYRVHGPKFLIEYCAVALTENHIHTVWRDLDNDFGEDLLGEHYRNNPH